LSDDNFSRKTKARAFGLTWLSYATYYLTRKNFDVAKAGMQTELGISTPMLGNINMVYSIGYAGGQFLSGFLADRVGPRRVLAIGMVCTAGLSVLFGMSSLPLLFLVLWALNGLAQSTGWPSNVKGMTPFFSRVGRGAVMGVWTTCYVVGGLVAGPVAEHFERRHDTWRAVFWGPVAFTLLVALAIFFFLPEIRLPVEPEARQRAAAERRAIRKQVLRQPILWGLGASYFFMKLTRYVFWGWSIFYLRKVLHYSGFWSVYASLPFEIGGFFGALTIGWVSDRRLQGRRVPAAIFGLVLLSASLVAYGQLAPMGLVPNMVGLFFVGFFLFGPDAIVSATAAQDIGGVAAAAVAAGVINGLGSTGQILSGPLAPLLTSGGNWNVLWLTLAGGALVGAAILLPFWKSRREGGRLQPHAAPGFLGADHHPVHRDAGIRCREAPSDRRRPRSLDQELQACRDGPERVGSLEEERDRGDQQGRRRGRGREEALAQERSGLVADRGREVRVLRDDAEICGDQGRQERDRQVGRAVGVEDQGALDVVACDPAGLEHRAEDVAAGGPA